MEDYLVRILTSDGSVRASACITTALCRTAAHIHHTTPTATAALGRCLTGGALMGSLLKQGQRCALKFEGNGPVRKIVIEADAGGVVRGTIGNPAAFLPPRTQGDHTGGSLDVAGMFGAAGLLTVVKDIGLSEPWRSTVHLVSGEIGEDLAWYFAESEQIPAAVGVSEYINPDGSIACAGGFLIQSMPPSDPANIESIIERVTSLTSLAALLREGSRPEDILAHLFSEVPFETLLKTPLQFACHCSRERFEQGLITLGKETLEEMAQKEEGITTQCDFCKKTFTFSSANLGDLAATLE